MVNKNNERLLPPPKREDGTSKNQTTSNFGHSNNTNETARNSFLHQKNVSERLAQKIKMDTT